MLTASARPDPAAPYARAEIIVRGLPAPPSSPAFQLRRSNVDYIEPNLDLTGWTRGDVTLHPLDAWWVSDDRSFHLLVSGLLCQFIDPGPLKLRLPGNGESDLFWPEDIAVYDDGSLAEHARERTDTVRILGAPPPIDPLPVDPPPVAPPPVAPPPVDLLPIEPPPHPPPPPARGLPPAAPQAIAPVEAVVPKVRPGPKLPKPALPAMRRQISSTVPLVAVAAVAVLAAAFTAYRHLPRGTAPGITQSQTGTLRAGRASAQPSMLDTLDTVLGEPADTSARLDPGLATQSAGVIISRVVDPDALLRYGVAKISLHEAVAADRLFEEATRPRFGPAHNRPYPLAYVARALVYDPSVQRDQPVPVPNAEFANDLYRRAIATAEPTAVSAARDQEQRLAAWRTR